MKAAVITSFGEPNVFDYADVNMPEPKVGEVGIRKFLRLASIASIIVRFQRRESRDKVPSRFRLRCGGCD